MSKIVSKIDFLNFFAEKSKFGNKELFFETVRHTRRIIREIFYGEKMVKYKLFGIQFWFIVQFGKSNIKKKPECWTNDFLTKMKNWAENNEINNWNGWVSGERIIEPMDSMDFWWFLIAMATCSHFWSNGWSWCRNNQLDCILSWSAIEVLVFETDHGHQF